MSEEIEKVEPKLKRARVTVAYTSDDGYSMESRFFGGPRNPSCTAPLECLRDAHRETARLLALFGRPDLATESTAEAVEAIAQWRAARREAAKATQ